MRLTPTAAYKQLNRLLWLNRLPPAALRRVSNATIPMCFGVTLYDDVFARPVILLNHHYKSWGKTLVHEMLHVAEPRLNHGKTFEALVDLYWNIARAEVKGLL